MEFASVPPGNGRHPVSLVVLPSHDPARSTDLFRAIFGWDAVALGATTFVCTPAAGPAVVVRASETAGPAEPFLAVEAIDVPLAAALAAGAEVVKPPWTVSRVGDLVRFRIPGGPVLGFHAGTPQVAALASPFGIGPKPPAGALCAIEIYSSDLAATAGFVERELGWGARETMPSYLGFDAGIGITGTFQSHTPEMPGLAYVYVTDVSATLRRIEDGGGSRVGDPGPVPGMGTFGYFTEPGGMQMGLIGP